MMMPPSVATLVVSLLALVQQALSGRHEARLIETLLNPSFNSMERPVESDDQPLRVEFSVSLQQIIDVDEKNQMIETNIWQTIRWTDYKLRWKPEDFGNITDIRLPVNKVWKPDILMYNSADTNFDGSYPVNVVVYSTGVVEQVPPGMFTSSCPIQIMWFPFDEQACEMKFGSWTYDGTRIDFQLPEGQTSGSIAEFSLNGEWDLLGMPAERNVQIYDCCPNNPYLDITFTIRIRRRKLYYMVNIVAPCLMLSALTLLTFLIPPEAGEKISFGVTILLSLTVFLLLVAEALPATSDAVPLIALYFACVMLLNALSVVFTVVVLSHHFRTGETHKMPDWVKQGICGRLAWLLRMQRPEDKEKAARSTASARKSQKPASNGTKGPASPSGGDGAEAQTPSMPRSPDSAGMELGAYPTAALPPPALPAAGGPSHQQHHKRDSSRSGGVAGLADEFSAARHELRAILRELQFITRQMRDGDESDKVSADWKFAAAVIDRLLLCIFAIFTVTATMAILFSAPNFFSSS